MRALGSGTLSSCARRLLLERKKGWATRAIKAVALVLMVLSGVAVYAQTSGSSSTDTDTESEGSGWWVALPLCASLLPLDEDGDGWDNACDNCPFSANSDQTDADGDGIGDACDPCPDDPSNVCAACPDGDSDGDCDDSDPCPSDPSNDADGDGVCGNSDNCPFADNPDQADMDNDGVGDSCDSCPGVPNPCGMFSYPPPGIDEFSSEAWVGMTLFDVASFGIPESVSGLTFAPYRGEMTVSRGEAVVVSGGYVEIPTEIVRMELIGSSSSGPITIRAGQEFSLSPSSGKILQQIPSTENSQLELPPPNYPPSFFDVFFEVSFTGMYGTQTTLRTQVPVHLQAESASIPLIEPLMTSLDESVLLYDENGNAAASIFAFVLVPQLHISPWVPPPCGLDIACQDLTTECNLPGGAIVDYSLPQVSGNCDPQLIGCSSPSGSFFPMGSTSVTCAVADAQVNVETCTFDVNVVDTTPPQITCPTGIVTECIGPEGTVVEYQAPATDLCDLNPTVVCTPPSGSLFPLGTTQVTCTAIDHSGNQATCTFPVEVKDTTSPAVVISTPVEGATFLSKERIGVNYALIECCDPTPAVTVSPGTPLGPPLEPGGLVITVKATDNSGNTGSASVAVKVEPIPAAFDFDPDRLNTASNNGLASGYIELQEGDGTYEDINLSTVQLEGPNGTIQPITDPRFGYVKSSSSYGVDKDGDRVLERLVKFYKDQVVEIVEAPSATLKIKGKLLASSPFGAAAFEGSDEVSVTGGGATAQAQGKAGRGKPVILVPDSYALFQNAPNPFNASTQIAYQLPEAGEVYLAVYNLMGQIVRVLVQEYQGTGYYQAEWNGQDEYGQPVSSGVYLYRFVSKGLAQTRRMLLVK